MIRPDEKKAAVEFDLWAESGRAESMAEGHRSAFLQAIENWNFSSEHTVADIGCGTGWVCRDMVARGAGAAIGVDISPKMIERARALSQDDSRFRFEVSSAATLPVPDGCLHRVTSVEALYYVPDPQSALEEWARACAKEAQLAIVIDLFKENEATHSWLEALDVEAHLLGADELVAMLKKAGFTQASWRLVQDDRPIKAEHEFTPSRYWPSYAMYRSYRETGSLIVDGVR